MSSYGVTFAHKLIQRGDYAEAIEAAARHQAQDPESSEPLFDRARALSGLCRYEEAVAAFEQALKLDREEQILPESELDDSVFTTLVAWAQSLPQSASSAERAAILLRYAQLLPDGTHRQEADEWLRRVRGELSTTWVKPRD